MISFKQAEAYKLQEKASSLFRMGVEAGPLYFEEYCRLGKEVFECSESLFPCCGDTPEEEAHICLALLMGYTSTAYNYGDKEEKKQQVLTRATKVVEELSDGLLKCQLLTYCYGEVFEEELASEARRIMQTWQEREWGEEECRIKETLDMMEQNPYPTIYMDN